MQQNFNDAEKQEPKGEAKSNENKMKKDFSFDDTQLDKILKTIKGLKLPEKMSFSVIDTGGRSTWSKQLLNKLPHYLLAFGTSHYLIGATNPFWFVTLSFFPTDASVSIAFSFLLAKMFTYSFKAFNRS